MRNFHKKTLAVVAGGVLLSSNALAYQSNSGAGTTTQPSMQYQQKMAEQQRQRSTYYYQPAPPASMPRPPQTQFIPNPIRGFPPVPVQLSPQAAQGIGNAASGCAGAAAFGYATGGPVKAGISCAAGAFGIAPGQLLRPKQAY